MADTILDPILEKHGLTRQDIAHGSPRKDPIRQARLEILLALTKAGRPAADVAKILNARPDHIRATLRKLDRKAGIPSAFPHADTSKAMRAKRARHFDGPMLIDAPGERKDCTLEATCVSNMVKFRPGAQHGSCPAVCPHFSPPNRDQRLDDAQRRGPGYVF